MGEANTLDSLLEIYKQDKIDHPERYRIRPETLVPGYDPRNDPQSPFYEGAHDAPMRPARKPNLCQLASLGVDIDLYLAGKPQL